MPSRCALCGRHGDMRQSHIIPKFALKWIKRTSATGYLASAGDAAKRIQDGMRAELLCGSCEELFSKSEKYFAENIFYPFHDGGARSFDYDDNLRFFATSLSWRALKISRGEAVRDLPHFAARIERAEACWREFLLGERQSIEPYENHLLFLDSEPIGGELGSIKWYAARGADSTLVMSPKSAFAYSLLPRMIVVTSMEPTSMNGWLGTAIKPNGKIGAGQRVTDPRLWEFLRERNKAGHTHSPGPSIEEGERRLRKAIEKDPTKVLKSETMQFIMEDQDEARRQEMRKKGMPERIVKIVGVITKSECAGDADAGDNNLMRWGERQIANALASLEIGEAEEAAKKIDNLIGRAVKGGVHVEELIKTSRIWVVFMVYHNATKKAQHEKIHGVVERLRPQRGGVKTPIVVISMNMECNECSFELGSSLA